MNRNANRKILVLLLLLAFTGQSLAALLAPCMLQESMSQQVSGMVMATAPQPASHGMTQHHAMQGTAMPASETHVMDMEIPMLHAMQTGNGPADTDHPDHHCCQGLCACITMGNFCQTTASGPELAPSLPGRALTAYPAERNDSPFLSPSLRPPIQPA
jgi:hypothetical protein